MTLTALEITKRGKMYLTALELKMLAFIFYRKLTLRPRQKIWYGPYDCILNGNNTNSNGVTVLFKNNFDFRLHTVIRDDEGKYIILDTEMLGKRRRKNIHGDALNHLFKGGSIIFSFLKS